MSRKRMYEVRLEATDTSAALTVSAYDRTEAKKAALLRVEANKVDWSGRTPSLEEVSISEVEDFGVDVTSYFSDNGK